MFIGLGAQAQLRLIPGAGARTDGESIADREVLAVQDFAAIRRVPTPTLHFSLLELCLAGPNPDAQDLFLGGNPLTSKGGRAPATR